MSHPDESFSPVGVYAVIPAAGQSKRMGAPKQLLSYGEGTVLETVIETVLAAPMNGLAVVANSAVADELDLAEDPRFLTAINDDAESQMLDSICLGLEALRAECNPPADSGILVCPGDMPGIDVEALKACVAAFVDRSNRIVVATHQGKHGHPIIVPLSMTAELSSITEGGLAVLLRRHPERVQEVECASSGVTRDLDTPEDYDSLQEQ